MIRMRIARNTASPGLQALAEQLPFATALSLNDLAADVKQREERRIDTTIDRPTPFTRKALFTRRATKRRLLAQVGLKDRQRDYLRLQITGGTRRPKGRALVVPANARLNKYGNLPRGSVKRSVARQDTFVASRSKPRTKHLEPGIYKRARVTKKSRRSKVSMLVAFERRAKYQSRLHFGRNTDKIARAQFPRHMQRNLRRALRTAK